ncbi:hypothetical protein [Mucisphaera sp.]|uniref:hypothetical protein n=1 Tax=Mucisphaera sp. TaxID=2913024 RepID=UPI003D0F3631
MKCNIDRRGQRLRTTLGSLHVVAAIVLAVLMLTGVLVSAWWWVAAGVIFAAGAFMIFEGVNGWCAVRAMGFQTPI